MTRFKQITVKYGLFTRNVTVSENANIASVVSDAGNKAYLGYGDNVQALVFGVVQDSGAIIPDGAIVEIEAKANQKAS